MYASIGRHLAPGLMVSRESPSGCIALRDPEFDLYLQLSLAEAAQLRDELTRLLAEAAVQPQAVSP